MRRGSTPTNTFTVPMDLHNATVYISYEQNGRVVVEKTNDDLTFDSSGDEFTISVQLSQEDTLAFRPGDVLIQIRYVFANGDADASDIVRTTVDRILKDGVIDHV